MGFVCFFPGPEASCNPSAEAHRQRSSQRGERNVPDLRLFGGTGDVRSSHQHQRREECLDETHTASCWEVCAMSTLLIRAGIHFLFVWCVCVPLNIFPTALPDSCPEEEEEERCAETEEARRAAEVRVQKITKFQGKKTFLWPCGHSVHSSSSLLFLKK